MMPENKRLTHEITAFLHQQNQIHIREIHQLYSQSPKYELWPMSPIYPTPDRFRFPNEIYHLLRNEFPNLKENTPQSRPACIEIMGLPEAGKSLALVNLLKVYPNLLIRAENSDANQILNKLDLTANLFNDAKASLLRQQLIEHWKYLSNLDFYKLLLEYKRQQLSHNPPRHFLVERGANDILAYDRLIIEAVLNTSPSRYPLEPEAIRLIQETDAVILYLNDLTTAQTRRLKSGKPKTSFLVNDQNWPYLETAYAWWLEILYPYLRQTMGTGLLVIDGTKPRGYNQRLITQYLSFVFAQAETGKLPARGVG